jgi:hypothetical protein
MRPVSLAPFALLEGLSERPQSQEAIIELCICITAASRRFRVGKGILKAIGTVARRDNIHFPAPCYRMIDAMTRSWEDSRSITAGQSPLTGVDYLLESGMIWISTEIPDKDISLFQTDSMTQRHVNDHS